VEFDEEILKETGGMIFFWGGDGLKIDFGGRWNLEKIQEG